MNNINKSKTQTVNMMTTVPAIKSVVSFANEKEYGTSKHTRGHFEEHISTTPLQSAANSAGIAVKRAYPKVHTPPTSSSDDGSISESTEMTDTSSASTPIKNKRNTFYAIQDEFRRAKQEMIVSASAAPLLENGIREAEDKESQPTVFATSKTKGRTVDVQFSEKPPLSNDGGSFCAFTMPTGPTMPPVEEPLLKSVLTTDVPLNPPQKPRWNTINRDREMKWEPMTASKEPTALVQKPKRTTKVGSGIVWDCMIDPVWRENCNLILAAGRRRKAIVLAEKRKREAEAGLEVAKARRTGLPKIRHRATNNSELEKEPIWEDNLLVVAPAEEHGP